MSFQDIATGRCPKLQHCPRLQRQPLDLSDVELDEAIFRVHTSVSRYKAHVNKLLMAQANQHAHFEKLLALEQEISHQIEQTVSKLNETENPTDHVVSSSATATRIRCAKMGRDLQSVLVEFQTAQKKFHFVSPPPEPTFCPSFEDSEAATCTVVEPPQQLIMGDQGFEANKEIRRDKIYHGDGDGYWLRQLIERLCSSSISRSLDT